MLGDVAVEHASPGEVAERDQELDPLAGGEVDRVAPAGLGRRHPVPAPDLERPGVQMEDVVLGVHVGDLPQLQIPQARLNRRELALAVRR